MHDDSSVYGFFSFCNNFYMDVLIFVNCGWKIVLLETCVFKINLI
jgi:hypothetical protein